MVCEVVGCHSVVEDRPMAMEQQQCHVHVTFGDVDAEGMHRQ